MAGRNLEQLDSVESLEDWRVPPGNRVEALKDARAGQHSIRINARLRICFVWQGGAEGDGVGIRPFAGTVNA